MHGGASKRTARARDSGSEFVVRLPLAAATPQASTGAGRAVTAPARRANRAASSSSTTTATRRKASPSCSRCSAPTRASNTAARTRSQTMRPTSPASCCSTSACPAWTGTRWRRRIRERPEFDDVVLVALTGWGQEEDRRAPRRRLRSPPHQAGGAGRSPSAAWATRRTRKGSRSRRFDLPSRVTAHAAATRARNGRRRHPRYPTTSEPPTSPAKVRGPASDRPSPRRDLAGRFSRRLLHDGLPDAHCPSIPVDGGLHFDRHARGERLRRTAQKRLQRAHGALAVAFCLRITGRHGNRAPLCLLREHRATCLHRSLHGTADGKRRASAPHRATRNARHLGHGLDDHDELVELRSMRSSAQSACASRPSRPRMMCTAFRAAPSGCAARGRGAPERRRGSRPARAASSSASSAAKATGARATRPAPAVAIPPNTA